MTPFKISSVSAIVSLMFLSGGASNVFAANEKILFHAMRGEPPQLNTMKLTDAESGMVMSHVVEGLARWSEKSDGSIEPGVAESWKVSTTGVTFKLRKNSKWSDGKPVTAKDFIFAWTTVLKPATASEYAFLLYPILNAEAINTKGMSPEQLGAKAVDDYTIEVTFEKEGGKPKPCAYFPYLTANPTYFPVRQDFYAAKGAKYGAEASDLLYNGPFVISQWTHGASLRFKKNPNYWDQKLVKLDGIEIPYMTPDPKTTYNLFKNGKIDLIQAIAKDDLPTASSDKFKVTSFPDSTTWYLEFNFRKKPDGKMSAGSNLNLRKAIMHAFYSDGRDDFISKVIGIPGTRKATTMIPSSIKGDKKLFSVEHPYVGPKATLEEAKKYADLARKELGGTLPALTILTDDTPNADRQAQYLQQILKTRIGLELKIDKQIFKQRLAKMTAGDFDIVTAGWGPDFPDVITYADLKTSWNENNRGHWENAEFDKHIRAAMKTADNAIRMKEFAAAQKILLDDVGVIPQYERVQIWTQSPRVTGVARRTFGPDPDFTRAQVK